jgi:hypothetical protein
MKGVEQTIEEADEQLKRLAKKYQNSKILL